jgi:hypothetical protein
VGTQSVLCPICQGVLPASGKGAYTPLRGRLIVTNGYCAGGCAERHAETVAAEQTQQVARPQQPMPQQPMGPQQMSQPMSQPMPRQPGMTAARPGGTALRVVR